MTITTLTDTEFKILDALRIFRYLTAEQMLRFKVAAHASHLYPVLRDLAKGKRPWLGKIDHGAMPGVGRIPAAHYLTEQGAKMLAGALELDPAEVPYPKGVVLVRHGFMHRLHTIDCEIAVRQWAAEHGHTVDYMASYFDVSGANRSKTKQRRRALTKIDLADGTGIIPDSVFHLTGSDGTPRLFVLEMYNQHRTKRMSDKLAEYRYAIGEHAIERQFDYPHSPRILAVFEDDKALELTVRNLTQRADFGAHFRPFFFFKTLPELMADFQSGWRGIENSQWARLF
ncbi:MAG: replication-relaxation family protein [Alphaproteobacteria bacterium]|nr:replication-relaxation family protein [Alphaproteobacteria bacterium]